MPLFILVVAMIPAAAYWFFSSNSVRAQNAARKDRKAPATHPTEVAAFIGEIQQILKNQNNRMATIAAPTLAAVDAIDRLNDRVMDQNWTTRTAEMNYEGAKLNREIAEIEIVAYKEGIAVQDRAVAEGELKRAQTDLEARGMTPRKRKFDWPVSRSLLPTSRPPISV